MEDEPFTLRPTLEEFTDPLHYIRLHHRLGTHHGLLKIIPPSTFQPSRITPQTTFKFQTRLQILSTLSGQSRQTVNLAHGLLKFHLSRGCWKDGDGEGRRVKAREFRVPRINGAIIDIFQLQTQVNAQTPYSTILHQLGLSKGQIGGDKLDHERVEVLKDLYIGWIAPYEKFVKGLEKGGMVSYALLEGENENYDTVQTLLNRLPRLVAKKEMREVVADSESELTDLECLSSPTEGKKLPAKEFEVTDDAVCLVCADKGGTLIVCDDCELAYHLKCHNPPLFKVSECNWYCVKCMLETGRGFGFENVRGLRSLDAFKRSCGEFKSSYFSTLEDVEEGLIEKEFWRLVSTPFDEVSVEYGADLQTHQVGTGFKRDPLYANSPWNLNNIPTSPLSLLKRLEEDVQGMMVPWLYVGMLFSAFAWHYEDHATYSINYSHFGAAKRWYFIPEEELVKFERVMREENAGLFALESDLLYHITTLMSPSVLQAHGVRVESTLQRTGEYVVTFPKAYHSGFNHGFNVNEAVNFAMGEWFASGFECVERYSQWGKACVFCHEWLVWVTGVDEVSLPLPLKSSLEEKDLKKFVSEMRDVESTTQHLLDHFVDLMDKQFRERAVLCELRVVTIYDDGAVKCQVCLRLCYFSAVVADGRGYCLNHGALVSVEKVEVEKVLVEKVLVVRVGEGELKWLKEALEVRLRRIGDELDFACSLLVDFTLYESSVKSISSVLPLSTDSLDSSDSTDSLVTSVKSVKSVQSVKSVKSVTSEKSESSDKSVQGDSSVQSVLPVPSSKSLKSVKCVTSGKRGKSDSSVQSVQSVTSDSTVQGVSTVKSVKSVQSVTSISNVKSVQSVKSVEMKVNKLILVLVSLRKRGAIVDSSRLEQSVQMLLQRGLKIHYKTLKLLFPSNASSIREYIDGTRLERPFNVHFTPHVELLYLHRTILTLFHQPTLTDLEHHLNLKLSRALSSNLACICCQAGKGILVACRICLGTFHEGCLVACLLCKVELGWNGDKKPKLSLIKSLLVDYFNRIEWYTTTLNTTLDQSSIEISSIESSSIESSSIESSIESSKESEKRDKSISEEKQSGRKRKRVKTNTSNDEEAQEFQEEDNDILQRIQRILQQLEKFQFHVEGLVRQGKDLKGILKRLYAGVCLLDLQETVEKLVMGM